MPKYGGGGKQGQKTLRAVVHVVIIDPPRAADLKITAPKEHIEISRNRHVTPTLLDYLDFSILN